MVVRLSSLVPVSVLLAAGVPACQGSAGKDDGSGDSMGETDDSGATDTSGDSGGESGQDSGGESGANNGEESGDSAPDALPARVDVSGQQAGRAFVLACTEADPAERLFRSLSDALGNLAGSVSCASPDAPHDRFELLFTAPSVGEWTDPVGGNQFQYSSDDGTLAWAAEGVNAWTLTFTVFEWQDTRVVRLVGTANGAWVDAKGTSTGELAASFDVYLECANCP